jgi:hypothetical protein
VERGNFLGKSRQLDVKGREDGKKSIKICRRAIHGRDFGVWGVGITRDIFFHNDYLIRNYK